MSTAVNRSTIDPQTRIMLWRVLGLTAALMMDACWMTAWVRFLTLAHSPPPAAVLLLWLTAVGAASYAIGRLSNLLALNKAVHHALGLTGIMLAFLLSINIVEGTLRGADIIRALASLSQAESQATLFPLPDAVVIFLVLVIIWQRGAKLSGTPDLVWKREGLHFRIGVLVYVAYILTRLEIGGSPTPGLLPTFFVTSLLAVAIARANSLVHARGGSSAPLRLRWMAGLVVMMVAAAGLGVGVAYALDSRAAHQAIQAAGLALSAILGVVFGLMFPLLMLFEPVIKLIFDLIRNVSQSLGELISQVQVQPPHAPPATIVPNKPHPAWVDAMAAAWPYIEWSLLFLLVVAAIYMATRPRHRTLRRRAADLARDEDLPRREEARERKGLLEQTQERLGNWIRTVAEQHWLAPYVIRRIYSSMLAKAARDGRPRRADETPAEFQQVLGDIYPAAAESAREITGAYELVRYGLRPEDPHIVERVREAWARLKQVTP